MHESLEGVNPEFVEWAEAANINLKDPEDFQLWLNCWISGYVSGASDLRKIFVYIRENGGYI